VRYFFSTGEASGEFAAAVLAETIRHIDPQAEFEGIGGRRMREAGFSIWRDHAGWASLGPLAAIPRVPKLALAAFHTDLHVIRTKPDAVVLVDFGAFNIRLAKQLRRYKRRLRDHHARLRNQPEELETARSFVLAAAEEEPDSEPVIGPATAMVVSCASAAVDSTNDAPNARPMSLIDFIRDPRVDRHRKYRLPAGFEGHCRLILP